MAWTELSVIMAAIGVGSLVKGVTGSGLPQFAIPVMAIFLGVERSVVVMAVPAVVSNAWLLWRYRSHLPRTRDLPLLVGAGVVGAVVGTWGLQALDPRALSGALAILVTGYVVLRVVHPNLHLRPATTRVLSGPVGLVAGALQGATGISGPLVVTWLSGYRLPPSVYVVSLVTVFEVFAVVQALALAGLGLFTPRRLAEGLLALVPMVLLLPVGAGLARHLSARTFETCVLVLLVGSAGTLAHAAVWG